MLFVFWIVVFVSCSVVVFLDMVLFFIIVIIYRLIKGLVIYRILIGMVFCRWFVGVGKMIYRCLSGMVFYSLLFVFVIFYIVG